jgi:hypothetical protein
MRNFDLAPSPYVMLWLAVLEQAKADACCDSKPRLQKHAVAWFTNRSEAPGSFRWLCRTVLDANPERVLRELTTPPSARRGVPGGLSRGVHSARGTIVSLAA